MSVYFVKTKKFWKYEFRHNKQRFTKAGFKTKKEALAEEAEKRKEVKNPKPEVVQTDMDFLELVERRLDYVESYNSERHYKDTVYMAKRWVRAWNGLTCKQVTSMEIQNFLIHIQKTISAHTANKHLRYLRALFNYGKNKPNEWIDTNPTEGIKFFPVEKIPKYVPPEKDILKVLETADQEASEYLWTITLTLARMSEINNLKKSDINFEDRIVTLYTRKKRDGSLTPRQIPMTQKLYDILKPRIEADKSNHPWVFWHRFFSRKENKYVEGKYTDRKTFMKNLCKKAGVKYFRFHPLRHFGASMLEKAGVPVRTIQDLLGHENRTTTEIYLHSFKGSDRKAMDLLESALSPNVPYQVPYQSKKALNEYR